MHEGLVMGCVMESARHGSRCRHLAMESAASAGEGHRTVAAAAAASYVARREEIAQCVWLWAAVAAVKSALRVVVAAVVAAAAACGVVAPVDEARRGAFR